MTGALTIRTAARPDIPRLVEMAIRFLETTRYGALVTPQPQALGALVAQVLKLGVVILAELDRWPCACAGYVKGHFSEVSNDFLCRSCGAPARQHGPYVVGMLALAALPHPLSGERIADEIAWWVEPEYRKGSIGPRLLRAAETWAQQQGLALIKMVAPAVPDGARDSVGAFYRKAGYEAVETAYQKAVPRRVAQEA